MSTPAPVPDLTNLFGDPAEQPGTKAFVERRFGRQASFGRRVVAQLVDGLIALPVVLVPLAAGTACLVAGLPETTVCDDGNLGCTVPGTGSTGMVVLGVALLLLSAVLGLAFEIWNQAIRMARTGQSLGRKAVGITVIDARTATHLTTGRALLKAVVSGTAGAISALWMLLDDDDRTLSDKVAQAAVIETTRAEPR